MNPEIAAGRLRLNRAIILDAGAAMSDEIVIVPTFAREDLLYLCLEAIRNQDANIPVMVFSDRGHQSIDLYAACEKFRTHLTIRQKTIGYGNSFNVIESMRYAVGSGVSICHIVEDDTILHAGYFDWARIQLASKVYAVALGRIPADTTSTWYEAPCASWDADCLSQCLEKVPLGYFANTREEMQKIVDAAFPHSHYRYGSAEQDGFFLRCLEFFKWKTAYPGQSFASHGGWWGYNRPGHEGPTGTFEEKIAACRKALNDREFRIRMFGQRITDSEMETWSGI